MRDDFSQRTKDLLANRVGWKCSTFLIRGRRIVMRDGA